MSRLAACALVLALAGCGGARTAEPEMRESPLELRLVEVASGLRSPVQVVAAPGERDRLYVAEQGGLVRVVERGRIRREPFLDLRARVRAGGEQGLLAVAFHPEYARTRRLAVHYTDRGGDTRVDEYRAGGGRPRQLLFVHQPYPNHNGGALAFGPDGRLYLGLGDGGAAFDPERRSQDLGSRLGKLLRLDVDRPGARWEIVAYGLRNPWRFSFDRASGDLWIGDVGQDLWEEVNVVPRGRRGPLNFGWDVYEGRERVEDEQPSGDAEFAWPVAVYAHDEGCSITGGVVYRGRGIPALRGRYLFGDYCSGAIWSLRLRGAEAVEVRRERVRLPRLVSFGEDEDGEVLLVSHAGRVLRLAG